MGKNMLGGNRKKKAKNNTTPQKRVLITKEFVEKKYDPNGSSHLSNETLDNALNMVTNDDKTYHVEYGYVTKALGSKRFAIYCEDEIERTGQAQKEKIHTNHLVLVNICKEMNKVYIIYEYSPEEHNILKRRGIIPNITIKLDGNEDDSNVDFYDTKDLVVSKKFKESRFKERSLKEKSDSDGSDSSEELDNRRKSDSDEDLPDIVDL